MFGYLEIFLKVYLYLSLEPNSLTVVNLQKRAISAQQKESSPRKEQIVDPT